MHPPLGRPGGLDIQGLRQKLQTIRTQVSLPSGIMRSKASPANSSREELKNPAIRSYRRDPAAGQIGNPSTDYGGRNIAESWGNMVDFQI